MLPAKPSFERIALNRVTFGARDTDVATAQSMGWAAWVSEQLNPPPGDDPALDAHLKAQLMRIVYRAPEAGTPGSWSAVDESRPLNYLSADSATLWNVAVNNGNTVSPAERTRIIQEMAIGHFIRNTHAKYQVREVMVDFWTNHFNVGRQESDFVACMLPLFDREAIRPHALGNFRSLLEAVATSTSMLFYLDNAESNRIQPNENYARELLELHTLGAGAYLGVSATTAGAALHIGVDAPGYTDQDVIEASRALSGWTVEFGQRLSTGGKLPSTGKFVYNANQHNTQAGKFLGLDLSAMIAPMQQGRMVLDVVAYHPATADFVCRKLAVRLFGDDPPATVIARAKTTWMAHHQSPDQIKKVLEAMLLDGSEIGIGPQLKVRRPYERLVAMFRTTDMVVNADPGMPAWVSTMGDSLYVWPEPDGRPDDNGFWLTSVAVLGTWNILITAPNAKAIQTTLYDQTPSASLGSAAQIADYWLDRMIGYQPAAATYNAIVAAIAAPGGVLSSLQTSKTATFEPAFRRLIALIAASEEFLYR
jgi:uncharacterized protein (DUF1800 family)